MNKYCSVAECSQKLDEYPYGSCQNCHKVSICDKQDQLHYDTLLYNEGCLAHHNGGYSVCIMCALEAFQTANYKKYEVGEEHCWCPCCNHDFGLLTDLPNTETVVEQLKQVQEDCSCSIEGCVAIDNHNGRFQGMSYGWCQACEEFSVCYRGASNEPEHESALLYHEPYGGEHEGSSFCKACTTKAYKEKYPDSTDERCICPLCSHDFGALEDL